MAETTLLRQSAIVRNASVGNSPPLSPPGAVKTGELPLVQMRTPPGAPPQVLTPRPKPVEILPPRDANSALRTGGLPMINVKMTAQGPQLDDGQDKPVVILPSRDQKHSIAAGGLPMVDVKMTSAGPQVQNMPPSQKAPPQIQAAQPAVSQPRRSWGAAPVVNKGRVVRVAAPKPELALPPVPELSADQLMLCRHLVGKYLMDLKTPAPMVQETMEPAGPASQDAVDSGERVVSTDASAVASEVPEGLVHLVEATIETIDQALVAVAVRAEAAEAAAVAAVAAVAAAAAVPAPAASIIPAAPSTSYVAGRVGARPNGYARAQRSAGQAPRRVAPGGAARGSGQDEWGPCCRSEPGGSSRSPGRTQGATVLRIRSRAGTGGV